jgi:hypothetical protein
LRDGKSTCSKGCDSFLLGELIKMLHRNGLIWPQPLKPFDGISIGIITNAVRDIQSKKWFSERQPWSSPGRATEKSRKRKNPNAGLAPVPTPDSLPNPILSEAHDCGVSNLILPELDAIEADVEGLELESRHGYYLY